MAALRILIITAVVVLPGFAAWLSSSRRTLVAATSLRDDQASTQGESENSALLASFLDSVAIDDPTPLTFRER